MLTIPMISLTVASIERALGFYQDVLGLHIHEQASDQVRLGTRATPLIELVERAGAQPKPPYTTGLYHVALLVPDREALAAVVQQFASTHYPLQGASDHGVSEALYLSDPDGNGIEIYADRPRNQWPRQNGELIMVVEPLDLRALVATHQSAAWQGIADGTVIGHIHLHVPQLQPAIDFYVREFGMELMQRYGQAAAFLSRDGYHHHVGLNTWTGVGAPPAPPTSAGLRWYALHGSGRPAATLTDPAGHVIHSE